MDHHDDDADHGMHGHATQHLHESPRHRKPAHVHHDEPVYARYNGPYNRRDSHQSTATCASSATNTSTITCSSPPTSRRGSLPGVSALLPPPSTSSNYAGGGANRWPGAYSPGPHRTGSFSSSPAHHHHQPRKRASFCAACGTSASSSTYAAGPARDLAHPYYANTGKRHSIANFRSTSASNSAAAAREQQYATAQGQQQPPLPVVRLPSIDQGLPPFAGGLDQFNHAGHPGMLLPLRRGSLTDPLMHAHGASGGSISPSPVAGHSNLAYSNMATYSAGPSLRPPSSHHMPQQQMQPSYYTQDQQSYLHQQPPPGLVGVDRSASVGSNTPTGASTASTSAAKEGKPLFGKGRTLFPQQHGSGSPVSPDRPDSATAPQIAGTKRKLGEVTSPSAELRAGGPQEPPLEASVLAAASGNYFAPHDARSANAAGHPAASNTKRRTSQPFLPSGVLPTPAATVGSATATTESASASDRRSSDGSNARAGDAVSGQAVTADGRPVQNGSGLSYSTAALPLAGAPGQRTQQQQQPDQLREDPTSRVVEVDTRPGYAFPLQAGQIPPGYPGAGGSYVPYANAAGPPPFGGSHQPFPPAASTSAVGAAPAGASRMPLDVRNRATMVFGDPRNGSDPRHNSSIPYAAPPRPQAVAGLITSHKSGSATPGENSAEMTGTTPYARSPALKVSHKIAERKRRKEMKELFDELRDSIPINMGGTGSNDLPGSGENPSLAGEAASSTADAAMRAAKSSKWEILAKAIEYVNKMQYEHQELNATVMELQGLNRAMHDELMALKSSAIMQQQGQLQYVSDAAMLGQQGQYQQDMSPGQGYAQMPHQQQPASATAATFPQSAHIPSPGSVHSMPAALSHQEHAMQHPGLTHQHSSSHSQTMLHSPHQAHWPVSAPPQSQTFLMGNDVGQPMFNYGQSSGPLQPPPLQHHPHSAQHQRTMSTPVAHFEHAGSAPPALQHASQSVNNSVVNSPIAPHNNGHGNIFAHPRQQSGGPGSVTPLDMSFANQQGLHGTVSGRPPSLHSHNSGQSVQSMHSHSHTPSHSPQLAQLHVPTPTIGNMQYAPPQAPNGQQGQDSWPQYIQTHNKTTSLPSAQAQQ